MCTEADATLGWTCGSRKKKKPVQCVCLKFERSNMSDTPGLEGPHSNDTFSDLPAGYQQV